jgi:RimJ/RimL family protein N-acetyltransferase
VTGVVAVSGPKSVARVSGTWLIEGMELVDIFPAFGLRIECGPVTLRAMRESDVPRVAELVTKGVHAEEARPFLMPWNLSETQPLDSLRFYYRNWAEFSPENWWTPFAVERDGVMVGAQDMKAEKFGVVRHAETGSWLGLHYQGRGTGTLMRQALLSFAFDHLGAVEMRSGAWADNPNSHRVSEKCGYVPCGYRLLDRQGTSVRQDDFVVTPEMFVRPPYEVVVTGADPFRRAIGLDVDA